MLGVGSAPFPSTNSPQPQQPEVPSSWQSLGSNPVGANTRRVKEQALPPPSIRASGPCNETIPECSESLGIDFDLDWYHLPSVPEFLICTACHAKHIAHSRHADAFSRIHRTKEQVSMCRFWVPRMADVLFPAAVSSGDLKPVEAFMAKRLTVLDCRGTTGATADVGVKWFEPEGVTADIGSCEACYEDRIVGTAFESRFSPFSKAQPADQTWACDMSNSYLARALKEYGTGGKNDWSAAVEAMQRRAAVPGCNGQPVEMEQRRWYVTRQPIKDFMVCETCFLDKVALTEFHDEFHVYAPPQKSDSNQLASFLGKVLAGDTAPVQVMCDLAIPAMAVAIGAALPRHDFGVFVNAANTIMASPRCTAEGVAGSTWYAHTAPEGTPPEKTFEICAACHAGYMVPCGFAPFFTPKSSDQTPKLCPFNSSSPRFFPGLAKFAEALTTGLITPFSDYVTVWAGVSPCKRDTIICNSRWWGWGPDACFCEECYLTVAQSSPLAATMSLSGLQSPNGMICCLYSARMRGLFASCCALDPPSPDVFMTAASERLVTFRTVMENIKMENQMRLLKTQQALHQGLLGTMYNGAASFQMAAGATDGYQYGNSQLGWYSTQSGATGAQCMENMRVGMREAGNPGDVMRVVKLEQIWRSVE
jgi:hypothetical protein